MAYNKQHVAARKLASAHRAGIAISGGGIIIAYHQRKTRGIIKRSAWRKKTYQ